MVRHRFAQEHYQITYTPVVLVIFDKGTNIAIVLLQGEAMQHKLSSIEFHKTV
jgi:hypothetical protein